MTYVDNAVMNCIHFQLQGSKSQKNFCALSYKNPVRIKRRNKYQFRIINTKYNNRLLI